MRRAASRLAIGVIAASVLGAASCGSSATPAPSPAPTLSGSWVGEQTLTSFSGAECFTEALQELMGLPSQFTATLTQTGNAISATSNVDHAGAVCTFGGLLDGTVLTFNATGCAREKAVAVKCPAGTRDIQVTAETIRVTIDGDRLTGTAEEHDTITVSGTSTVVGTLVGTASVSLTRR